MFKWLNNLLKNTVKYENDGGLQIAVNIRAPKNKVSSCIAVVQKYIYVKNPEKGRWLCTNVRGDHFLVEIDKYEVYVEYLTTPVYNHMEKIWDRGLIL